MIINEKKNKMIATPINPIGFSANNARFVRILRSIKRSLICHRGVSNDTTGVGEAGEISAIICLFCFYEYYE
jgi:hypothetical protein